MAIGIGVVVSQYFGAKDERNTSVAIANGVYVSLIVAVFMTVVAYLLTEPILRLLGMPDSLMHDAVAFMRIFMGGLLALATYYTSFSILRVLSDAKTSLIFLIFCSVLNVVLDLLFLVQFGMGVADAAFSTVLSQVVAAVLCITYALKKVTYFREALKYVKLCSTELAIPSMLWQMA